MTIPDEAVQAASEIICAHDNAQWGDSGSSDMYHDLVGKMLTAALPFLQGVKVKALAWQSELPFHVARTSFGGFYCIEAVWNENDFVHVKLGGPLLRDRNFQTVKDAKSAAQADYEARILSAIEVSVCQTCKGHGIIGGLYRVGDGDVDGWEEACPDCAPSPRAQALEEEAKLCDDLETKTNRPSRCAAAIRALSSQPLADRCNSREAMRQEVVLMIERLYSDYTWHHQLIDNVMALPASPGASE